MFADALQVKSGKMEDMLCAGEEQTLPCRRQSWHGLDGDLQWILM